MNSGVGARDYFPWVACVATCAAFAIGVILPPLAVSLLAILSGYIFAIIPRPEPSEIFFPQHPPAIRRRRHTSHLYEHGLRDRGTSEIGSSASTYSPPPSARTAPPEMEHVCPAPDPSYALIFDGARCEGRAPVDTPVSSILSAYAATGLLRCAPGGGFLLDPGDALVGDDALSGGCCYRIVRGGNAVTKCSRCGARHQLSDLVLVENKPVCADCRSREQAENAKREVAEEKRKQGSLVLRPIRYALSLVPRPFSRW